MTDTIRNLGNSVIAATCAELITLPICALKTNYQNTASNSIISTFIKIKQTSGIKGFYNASLPAISSQAFSTSIKYCIYKRLIKEFSDESPGLDKRFLCGTTSGLISTIFTHPIDVIKIHMQMRKSFITELKKEGLFLFGRGYSKTLSKILIASTLYLPLMDYFTERTGNIYSGAILSSIISTTCVHPLDYLKTRHVYNLPLYTGLNPMIYYKGLSLNLLRIVPHFTIMMAIISSNPMKKWS